MAILQINTFLLILYPILLYLFFRTYFFVNCDDRAKKHNSPMFSLPVFRFISTALQNFRFIFLRQTSFVLVLSARFSRYALLYYFFDDISARTPNNIDISASYALDLLCPLPWDTSRLIIFCNCQPLLLLYRSLYLSIA